MNENEVMNAEVVETTEEVAKRAGVDGRDFVGIAIGIGLAVGVQFVYNRVVKPGIAKYKAAKEASAEKVIHISDDQLNIE